MNDHKPKLPLSPTLSPGDAGGEGAERPSLLQRLAIQTSERERASLLRRSRTVDHADGPWLEVDGRRLLGFCSNDYLGLAQHPRLIEIGRAPSELQSHVN